jgi:tetratricopeptide (TPR) repeat protein
MAIPTTLVVEHVCLPSDSFIVHRAVFGASDPVAVPSPYVYPVAGLPDSNLMAELQWYLERFLEFPFPPETGRADRVLNALEGWGLEAYEALFREFNLDELLTSSNSEDQSGLRFEIHSHSPTILSWPWEALRNPRIGPVIASNHISRNLGRLEISELTGRPTLSASLPEDRVNILLIVPRPFGDADIRYRSIARSLVELIETENLPARVDVLRPPTLARLRDYLDLHPSRYHILHFDGHGSYAGSGSPQGHLVFEKPDGSPDPISAVQLRELLQGRLIPGVVLNACQSAMINPNAESAFASVAAALVSAGVRSVVAMSYALYVSGACELLPAFYRALFEKGSMNEAVQSGRNRMRAQRGRVCARGRFDLEDWIIPVLYEHASLVLPFGVSTAATPRESVLPEKLRHEKEHSRAIGRDGPILALERALYRAPAGLLITGLGGVGKTTLAFGFLQWLDATNGLDRPPFWFDMREIRSAAYIFDRIGEQIFGPQFLNAPRENKLERLLSTLRERRAIIVWDNFESVSGIPGTRIAANLTDADRALLADFLHSLVGTPTKVIITSRSEEVWLDSKSRWRLPLPGLDGEERWEYCEFLLNERGLKVDRSNPELLRLMNLLGGHPLTMQIVLSQLGDQTPIHLVEALRTNFTSLRLDSVGEEETQLLSALHLLDQAVPDALRPLLIPLSLHEVYFNSEDFKSLAHKASKAWEPSQIDRFVNILVSAGLLRAIRHNQFEMHPVLAGYLRSTVPHDDAWSRAFVDVMGTLASELSSELVREKRPPFFRYSASFYSALGEARRLNMDVDDRALTEALGLWAMENRELGEAEKLFHHLLTYAESVGGACQQLGIVAQRKRDLINAEDWFRKSLEHKEQLGAGGEASTYHHLGINAEGQGNFANAESFYLKSLKIKETLGDDRRTAISYHQLGRLAEKARNFRAAGMWYQKSLDLSLKLNDESAIAIAYHQLGVVEVEIGDVITAERLFRQAIAINEKLGLQAAAAMNYHELGIIADRAGDLSDAEQWYVKSLQIKERIGDLSGTANSYHQLGIIAQRSHDFVAAREWHHRSRNIRIQLADSYSVAASSMMLGAVAAEAGDYLESGKWSVEALRVFAKTIPEYARLTAENFMYAYNCAQATEKVQLREHWAQANLGPFPQSR